MYKKVISVLLSLVVLFGLMSTAVPVYAANANEFVITPDKTEVNPGDTITYTVTIGPVVNFQSANFTLVIPEGLTFVSGTLAEGLKELTGAAEASFTESTLTFFHGGIGEYTSDQDTKLMTFVCTVDERASGNYIIEIMDDYDFADSNWTSYDMSINTDASAIEVLKPAVAATGIKLNKETLALKTGESETLTAVLEPENTTDTVSWKSNDEDIVTVDENGQVTAKSVGETTITATAGNVSATCSVSVECAHVNTTKHEAETGTCIAPGHAEYIICNDCETVISGSDAPITGPHGNYVDKAEEKYMKSAADCTNAAVYYKSCELCGAAHETDTFVYGEALGHDYGEATCTQPRTCKRCEATEGEALGHSYSEEWSKGENGHWHECVACGDKQDEAEHDFGEVGDICIICGYEREHVHNLTQVPAVDATCVSDGNKAYFTCSGCEEWFEDAEGTSIISDKTAVVIPAMGHDIRPATCTEAAKCQREGCGYIEGAPLGHSFTNYVSDGNASCETDGTKTAKCDRCDATDTIADTGSAKGHNYEEATCITPQKCRVCGKTQGEALGHSFINYVTNNDATCTEDGTKTAKCERCNETDTIVDAGTAKGHDYAEATCTKPMTCKSCGSTVGEALGHDYEDTWSGGKDGHWHACVRCGDRVDLTAHDFGTEGDKCLICEYERDHVHRLTLVSGVEATCLEGGRKAYYICSGCEDWFEDEAGRNVIEDKTSVNLTALGHDMAAATCTEASYCQREGCSYTEGTALGHDFEQEWTFGINSHWHNCSRCDARMDEAAHVPGPEATETTPQTCTICGYDIVSALGHTHKLTRVEGTVTCTEAGNKTYYTCECGKWFADAAAAVEITDKDSVKLNALGHQDNNKDNICDVCGARIEDNSQSGSTEGSSGSTSGGSGTGGAQAQTPVSSPIANSSPRTSDDNYIATWITIVFLSCSGIMLLFTFYKKKYKKL